MKSDGTLISKFAIPRKMKLSELDEEYSSFITIQNTKKTSFLFYDDSKNESLTSYSKDIKIKQVTHDNDLDLYMVTINENNKISKSKVIKANTGNLKELNKKQNFETKTAIFLTKNKLLVESGTSFGILTIE
jgi:hypothetical protein